MIPRSRNLRIALAVGVLLVLGIGLIAFRPRAATTLTYVPVDRGDVVQFVVASGTVNPVQLIEVGTYVSGVIDQLHCDYNTEVRKGQLCARIDPKPYVVAVDQARANLDAAAAQLAKDQAARTYAAQSRQRQAQLAATDSTSGDAVDAAANALSQADAQIAVDKAQLAQKQAALEAANVNLGYTRITSPVSGVVVARNVTAGQTVAASFQTPTLFLIAEDLTKMQVDANVSESDIALIHTGARATFTVDAWPGRSFEGRVVQVRQAPISVQNVITYDVVIAVDNSALQLKPGMTATAHFILADARNVLRVPSQALRFTPPGASPRPKGQRGVYVDRGGHLALVEVTQGLDDGTFTEVRSPSLQTGDRVAIGVASGPRSPATTGPRL